MLKFEFNAQAYKDSLQHELIPEGRYRARITALEVRSLSDGTIILTLSYLVTYKNLTFKDTIFLNPRGHQYFKSSNKRFGDLCESCKVSPFDVQRDENILIGCVCGIELAHKKSKDGLATYNSVKKFLRPDETEQLKEFSSSSNSTPTQPHSADSGNAPESFNPDDGTALDPDNPDSWFR